MTQFTSACTGGRQQNSRHICAGILVIWLLAVNPSSSVWAQRQESQAIPGRPFGVAAITFQTSGGSVNRPIDPWIEDLDHRIFYPAFASGGLLRLLTNDDSASDNSGRKTVFFLFTGEAPLTLTLHAPLPSTVTVRPDPQSPRGHSRLLQRWWREYNSAADSLARNGDYPPLIQLYLNGMLGQRLGLRPPLLSRLQQESTSDVQQLFDLLAGTERLHHAMLRETMAGPRAESPANQPVPAEVSWRPPAISLPTIPEIEPIAQHVPAECYYLRFGSFENYLWLEDLMTSYGGDIGRMVTARGQDSKAGDRIRRQLSLPQTALAKIFGGQLIADVALIGRDMYLQNGAAVGVLFQAKNSTLLAVSLNQQRNATLSAERGTGATLEPVKIGGRDVTLLSNPDNSIRSFYAIDGDAHLVTTSKAIVERFFETGDGKNVLAELPEFQRARAVMPLARNDTIFAFLSTHFLSGLLSPQYQIELSRRTQALVDLELVRMAQLAAAAEEQPANSMDDLIAGGFLPTGFGRQPDGSGPILEASRAIDSLRGARGTFLPVPDVEVSSATGAEIARYQALTTASFERWQQLDPVMCAIRRETLADKRERLTLDANVSPLSEEKYGRILSVLGPPVTQRVVPRAGDVISAQAFVTGGQFSTVIPPHLIFVGVQDLEAPIDITGQGLLQWLRILRTTPGYIGAWPKPGFVDWLPLRADPAAPDGLSRLLFDVWRWQAGGFSVLSFHREVLDTIAPQLQVAEADDPAQIRIHVEDLSRSRLKDWINSLYYQRAWQTSVANTQLLSALTQQLRVPPDKALSAAENLLNTQFVCPLGGKYELAEVHPGHSTWRSTAWPSMPTEGVPTDYRAPLLEWFRSLDLSLTKTGDQITVRAKVDMQR